MEISVRGHERAVEALKKKDALGEISEEPSIPAGIPDKVRKKLTTGRAT